MLMFNRLRIDPGDGSPAEDYRIEDGCVQSRLLTTAAGKSGVVEKQWQRLTPEQLRFHVMANTVVARWLRHRIGVHRLIRACNEDYALANDQALEWSDRTAA
jgi:hypothetical protein